MIRNFATMRAWVALFALLALLAVPAFAQQQTGDLIVKATDQTGAVVAGAKVTLTSPALIKSIEGTTDGSGIFRSALLPPGTYKVTVTHTGFATAVRDQIAVQVGKAYTIDVPMKVGSGGEVIEVNASAIQIDTIKSESSENISTTVLNSLPGARNFDDFAKILPSVNNESSLSGWSVDGASGAENVFYIDGVDTSNIYGGTNNQSVRTETVQELQIKSGGYEAEFGGAMGGVISVVTKSGTNAYHGELYYYYNGSKLEGADRKTLRLVPGLEPAEAEYINYPKDNLNRNEFGFSLGGPLLGKYSQDKAWFFANINPTWVNETRNTTTQDVNGVSHPGSFKYNALTRRGVFKLDFQPLQKVRLFGSYAQDSWTWRGGLPSKLGDSSFEYPWSIDGQTFPSYTFNGGATITATPKLLIDTRYGFNGVNQKNFINPSAPTHLFRTAPSVIGYTTTTPGFHNSGWYNFNPNTVQYQLVEDFQKKLSWNNVGSWIVNAGGQHNFKFGYDWARVAWDDISAHPFDYVRLNFGRSWTTLDGVSHSSSCTGPDGLVHTPCGYVEYRSPFGTLAKIHTDRQALFFQDSWTIKGRLTINPGIRFEKEEIPSFSNLPQFAGAVIKWGFGEKIAPRFGAVYDLFGNGKAKIFGNFGKFYDNMKLGMAEGSFGGFKWHSQYYLMNQAVAGQFVGGTWVPGWPNLGGAHDPAGFTNGCTGSVTGGPVDCSGATTTLGMPYLEDRDWRIPSFDSLDPDTKPMAMYNLSGGFEMQVKEHYIASATYVRKHLIRTIEDVGVLSPGGEAYYTTNPGFGYSISKFIEAGLPATPKAKREYDAFELRLRRPLRNNFMFDASYTYSKLRGNYSGLATSDEEGRDDPNVSRYFDLWFLNYSANGRLVEGPLNTDRPHQFKVSGSYQLGKNLPMVGFFFNAQSGIPISRELTVHDAEMLVEGRMTDGRTPFFSQTDINLIQTFKPFKDESKEIKVSFTVANLFNQKAVLHKYRLLNRSTIGFCDDWLDGGTHAGQVCPYEGMTSIPVGAADVQYFLQNGWDWQQALTAANGPAQGGGTVLDPRFGMADSFLGPINARFGIKFIF